MWGIFCWHITLCHQDAINQSSYVIKIESLDMKNTAVMDQNMLSSGFDSKKVMMLLVAAFGVVAFALAFNALAATGTLEGEFADMWDEVKGLAGGAPGKILMMLMVMGVVFFSTVKPNLVGFAGCVVSVLVLGNAGKIIDSSLTSTIFDAPAALLPLIGG